MPEPKSIPLWLYGILSIGAFPVLIIMAVVAGKEIRIPLGLQEVIFAVSILAGPFFGIIAWVKAQRGLKAAAQESGENPDLRGMKIARILGIVGIFLVTPLYLVALIGLSSSGSLVSNKDALRMRLIDIGSHAYEYRIRPTSLAGGGGSYAGYELPERLREEENGRYSVQRVAEDSIIVIGISHMDSLTTMTAVVGDEGKVVRWEFGGYFKE